MIVVEYEDSQFGELMEQVECFEEMAKKIKEKAKSLKEIIGENAMSQRMGKRHHPEEDEEDDDMEYRRGRSRRSRYM